MGIRDWFRRERKMDALKQYFELFTAYAPAFSSFEGGLYEMELTRAAIHSFATHISKLKPNVNGSNNERLERMLQHQPNAVQDTTKWLYRLATVFMVQNNVFVLPIYDEFGEVNGLWTLLPQNTEIRRFNGKLYLRYQTMNGTNAIEFERVGLLNQFQYKNDIFGESNRALEPTLELLDTQNQGIIEGVKSSATIRFLGKLAQTLKAEDIEKERKRFVENNLSVKNNGGVMLIDQKYQEIKQLESRPFTVDAKQMEQIKENVFTYFGTNEAILQNKYTSDEWNAYYEGKLEPFVIQLSLTLTNMFFSDREIAFGNEVIFSANRLQYLTNAEKLSTVTQLFDRGFITHNEGLEIFNMPPIGEDGDKRYIRKEYAQSECIDDFMREAGGEREKESGISNDAAVVTDDGEGTED